jgi:hypothetical protein
VTEPRSGQPLYHGIFKHLDTKGGYAVWLPMGWTELKMGKGHQGAVFLPEAEVQDTYFSCESFKLRFAVTEEDVPVLREGFSAGLQALPGIEIESQDETVTATLIAFDARFTFLEDEARRKRWVRNIYWGKSQMVFIAQGSAPAEFDYWLPMFYQTMMTFEV